MDPTESNAKGATRNSMKSSKNKKAMAAIGGALIAIGVAGMVVFGAQSLGIANSIYASQDQGKSIQVTEYVFLFAIVAGLVVMLYSLVGIQRDRAKARQSPKANSQSDLDTRAA